MNRSIRARMIASGAIKPPAPQPKGMPDPRALAARQAECKRRVPSPPAVLEVA